MKALKIIGGILIFLALVLIILNFIAPKEYQVERSLIIDAPKEIVNTGVPGIPGRRGPNGIK